MSAEGIITVFFTIVTQQSLHPVLFVKIYITYPIAYEMTLSFEILYIATRDTDLGGNMSHVEHYRLNYSRWVFWRASALSFYPELNNTHPGPISVVAFPKMLTSWQFTKMRSF